MSQSSNSILDEPGRGEERAAPRILLLEFPARGGVNVIAQMACGHEQQCLFLSAPRRNQQLHDWVFGAQPERSMCGQCREQAQP